MKFLRYLQKKCRAMFAMAALTFFAAPLAAQASTITTKDGKTLTAKNKVYNIEVQKKLSEQVGVNKFKDFTFNSTSSRRSKTSLTTKSVSTAQSTPCATAKSAAICTFSAPKVSQSAKRAS